MFISKDALKLFPECEYVYVIQDVDVTGYCKIGRTNNPSRRLYEFGVKLPFETGIIRIMPTYDAAALENYLHVKFHDKRVRGEWFNLSKDDLLTLLSMATDIDASKRFTPEPFTVEIKHGWRNSQMLHYTLRSKTSMHGVFITITDSKTQIGWTHATTMNEFIFPEIAELLPTTISEAIVMYHMFGHAINLAMEFEINKENS